MSKSVISLTLLELLKNEYLDLEKALVIAPKRVAEDTWPREVKKWDHLKDLKLVEIRGTPKQRLEAIETPGDVYIISRDNLTWLVDELQKIWPFDVVVIDELSSFKSHQAKRFKSLRKVRPKIKRLIGLTGTPAPNGYLDLWSQIYLLDQGERLGKNITAFRRKFCETLYRPGYNEYRLHDWAHADIDKRIADICISMKSKDYLKMEEPQYLKRYARLTEKERRAYKKMEEEALLAFEDGEVAEAFSAAAVLNKLLQISNGAVYTEEEEFKIIHNRKLEVLEELIEEAQEEPVLVFYNFKSDKGRILESKIPGIRTLETEKDIEDWNNKKIPVLLAHPASAGHGLNLQEGGSIIIWFGLNWSLELYQQANARLQRQGQEETVRIYHILTEDTVDEKVLEVLNGKDLRQEDLLRALKA